MRDRRRHRRAKRRKGMQVRATERAIPHANRRVRVARSRVPTTSMGSKLLAAAVAVLVLGTSASAVAAPSAADKETARHAMDDGKAFMQSGDFPKAVDAYKKAHDIMHVPT